MDDVLILEIAVGVIFAPLVFSLLYRASIGTVLRTLIALGALVGGIMVAISTTAVGQAWDGFVGKLEAFGRACVAVFL